MENKTPAKDSENRLDHKQTHKGYFQKSTKERLRNKKHPKLMILAPLGTYFRKTATKLIIKIKKSLQVINL